MEIKDLYSRLMNSIRIKKPTITDMKACLLNCGIPNNDKRGVRNLANGIEDFVVSNFSDKVETDYGYEPILHWILNNNNEVEIRVLIAHLVGELEILFSFEEDADTDEDLEYLKISLFESLEDVENNQDDYMKIYYTKMVQATDQLIVMHRLDATMEYIFNYNGVCLNDEVRLLIYKNYEGDYFGGNLTFELGDNNSIIVAESGNEYYYPTCKYLLSFEEDTVRMVKRIEEDFQIETHSSQNVAIELTRMFMGSIA